MPENPPPNENLPSTTPKDPEIFTRTQDIKQDANSFENLLKNMNLLQEAVNALKTTSPTSKVKIDMTKSDFDEIIGYYINISKIEFAENLSMIRIKLIFKEAPIPKEHEKQINEMTKHIKQIYPGEDIKIYYSRDFSSTDSKAYGNIQIGGSVIGFPINYDEFMKMGAIELDKLINQDHRMTKYISKLGEDFTSGNYSIEELFKDPRAYNCFELYNLNPSGTPKFPENYEKFDKKIYDYLILKGIINSSINFDSGSFYKNFNIKKFPDGKIQLQVLPNISKNGQEETINF